MKNDDKTPSQKRAERVQRKYERLENYVRNRLADLTPEDLLKEWWAAKYGPLLPIGRWHIKMAEQIEEIMEQQSGPQSN